MSLTILTLNLWRYYEWESRLPRILEYARRTKPDVILLQEVQLDWRRSPINQAELLDLELGYGHSLFASCGHKENQRGEAVDPPAQLGLGVISRFPLERIEQIALTQAKDDKDRRIVLNFEVTKKGIRYPITNVHFSNRDDWAAAHFRETLSHISRQQPQARIMAGDFNLFDLGTERAAWEKLCTSSADAYPYRSYPSRGGTLDYILLPHSFSFEEFTCAEEELSDHRALLARIGPI